MEYKYINKNAPLEKINYSYSKFGGNEFLKAWENTRDGFLQNSNSNCKYKLINIPSNETEKLFLKWIDEISSQRFTDFNKLYLLLKRFEVTKKIFTSYDMNFRPENKLAFQNYSLYVLFSLVLCIVYEKYKKLQFLNSLLKINDIIFGIVEFLDENEKSMFSYCIKKEMEFILTLKNDLV